MTKAADMTPGAKRLAARCRGQSLVSWLLTLAESKRLLELPPPLLELAEAIHGGYCKGFHDGALCGYEQAEEAAAS